MLLHGVFALSCNIWHASTYHSPLICIGLQFDCGYISNVEQLLKCQYQVQLLLAGEAAVKLLKQMW